MNYSEVVLRWAGPDGSGRCPGVPDPPQKPFSLTFAFLSAAAAETQRSANESLNLASRSPRLRPLKSGL